MFLILNYSFINCHNNVLIDVPNSNNIYMVWIYICFTITASKEVSLNVYGDLINFVGNQIFSIYIFKFSM